ncbi:MAG: glycoside hydrolase family protein [Pseudomonadota bacterium]
MARPMRTSRQGLDLIRSFEGFRARSTPIGEGRWVIGYGHTRSARKGLEVTAEDALKILKHYDLPPIEAAIRQWVHAPLNQNQFDALASFAFNLGLDTFRTSDVLAHVNAGEPLMAATAMGAWRQAMINGRTITVDALVRRRAMERALFLESPRGRPVAPSAMVKPMREPGRGEPPLSETPAQLDVSDETPRIVGTPDPVSQAPVSQTPVVQAQPTKVSPANDAAAPTTASERTSEATAKRIGERVTRILNDSPGVPPDRPPDRPSPTAPAIPEASTNKGAPPKPAPSVDDIQAAVAAIADPDPVPAVQTERADADDLPTPPPPGIFAPSSERSVIIDDLEPISMEDLEAAGRTSPDWPTLIPYIFGAAIGVMLAILGLDQMSRTASQATGSGEPPPFSIAPFILIFGAILALLMTYQALRAILRGR